MLHGQKLRTSPGGISLKVYSLTDFLFRITLKYETVNQVSHNNFTSFNF